MTITLRRDTGKPLTWDQLDGNFTELRDGLVQVGNQIVLIDQAVIDSQAAAAEADEARNQAVAAAAIYDDMNAAFVQMGIAVDDLSAQVINNDTVLSTAAGAGKIGYLQQGAGSVLRHASDKFYELVSVKDKGAAVDGVTDDGAAIAAARAAVSANGGLVIYGGKTEAADFWGNLAPRAMECILGSATNYVTDIESSKPLMGAKMFQGTPTAGAGYAGFASRIDTYTKTGVDVASTVTAMFAMQSYSTNSSGANFNSTNQVALVANASAMDANSSASVEAINAIAASNYTGPLAQMVVGVETDGASARDAGWFGEASKTYTVGFSAILQGSSAGNGTVAYSCDTSSGTTTWWHGAVLAGTSKTGMTVARNGTLRPESGVWVSAATTFGIYVGAKAKHQLNPGSVADYAYRPAIGIGLGQEGATSAASQKLRFVSTNGASAELNADVFTDASGSLQFAFAGTNRFAIAAATGAISIQGNVVLGARNTGWGGVTGTTSKAAFNTATADNDQMRQAIGALINLALTQGFAGA